MGKFYVVKALHEGETDPLNIGDSKQTLLKRKISDDAVGKKEVAKKGKEIITGAKDFLYGFGVHGMVTYALRIRMTMENLFMLITMGDMLGVPVIPPYYSLRLLPYVVPQIKTWKSTLLRERDITDVIY